MRLPEESEAPPSSHLSPATNTPSALIGERAPEGRESGKRMELFPATEVDSKYCIVHSRENISYTELLGGRDGRLVVVVRI